MKRMIVWLVVCVMLIASTNIAFAERAKYANTKAFLAKLDEVGYTYTVLGINDDKDEWVTLGMRGDKVSFNIDYYFNEDNSEVRIRVWDLLSFKGSDLSNVLHTVNELNLNWRYCTWFVFEDDNTVSVSFDVLLRENEDVGDIVYEAMYHVCSIIDLGYESLEKYAQ